MRTRRLAAALFGLALLAAPARADPPPRAPSAGPGAAIEDGAVAPDGCWTVEAGCPARTAETATRAPRGDLEVAWRFDVKGLIEGEPRVWKDRVLLCEASSTKANQRILRALSLADGSESYRRTFDADVPLEPAVWQSAVVVRANADRLEGWAIGERMFTKRWTAQGRGFAPPILLRDEVYSLDADRVARWRFGKPGEVWSHPLTDGERGRPQGELSLRGDSVYAVAHDAQGNAEIHRLLRDGGASVEKVFIGYHGQGAVLSKSHPRIFVGARHVLVHFDLPVLTKDDAPADLSVLSRPSRSGGRGMTFRTLLSSPSLPAAVGESWVGPILGGEKGAKGLELIRPLPEQEAAGLRFEIFASAKIHPRFLDPSHPPIVARGTVLIGARAFDPETRDVLRDLDRDFVGRPVPAKGLLLVVEGGTRLTAYREAGGAAPAAALLEPPPVAEGAAPGAPRAVEGGAAVLVDGTVRSGSFAYDAAGSTLATLATGKDRAVLPLARVLAVFGKDRRRILYARDAAEAVHAVEALAEADAGREYVRLAEDACRANDPALARRLLWEASVRAAPEADLARVDKQALLLEQKQKEQKQKPRDASLVAKVGAREAEIPARVPAALWASSQAVPDEAPSHLRAALVRATLARVPDHAEATAWVRSRLPAGIVPVDPFEAADWLEFEQAVEQAPIQVVAPPKPGQPERELTFRQKQLGSGRHFWRPDLEGIESRQLLILTPLTSPGRIARCLSMGELVCDTLEGIFAEGTKKREERYPLLHHLYESKEEYLRESTKHEEGAARDAAMRGIANTLGHYDSADQVSRLFLRTGTDAADELMSTYAHELTHHWVDMRCPLFTDAERDGGGGRVPGYWIVEGLATMVEEFRYDLATRRVETFVPRASALDVVANVPAGAAIPWPTLFDLDPLQFHALPREPSVEVPLLWRLGTFRRLSVVNLFYEQSAAACHYLFHAEGGKHRKALVAYVADEACGRTRRGDLKARFGMDADELGRRIEAWAKRVVRGGER